ncbi:MAG TPA: agmatine deiminase family protein, partial [Gemmatimonadales bacterium]|nr:agmatine deiminase family protein [Gemmatimonadales bacterium]
SSGSPAALGYRMPAEWAPHRATWLSWPHRESSWPGRFGPVPGAFVEIVRHLVEGEEIHINVTGPEMAEDVRRRLTAAGLGAALAEPSARILLHLNPTNDAWCRDHGPIFLQRRANGTVDEAIVDWGYNAWGGKYPPYQDDDVIPLRIGREFRIPVFQPGIVMEGGSLDVNGEGTLLTTESCLLNPNRNPGMSRAEIETYLGDYLGASRVLWLGDGIEGDDTDGHVDDLARFVNPTTVVTVVEPDPRDKNHGPLRDNRERLQHMTDQADRPLRVLTLPMPPPMYLDGQRVPASYANFYIANRVVLLPAYEAPTDETARQTLQSCFPDRRVVPLDSRDLIWGLGSFHCVTQQWPAIGG